VTGIINIVVLIVTGMCNCGTKICIISQTAGCTTRQTVNRICISWVERERERERESGPQLWSKLEGLEQSPPLMYVTSNM
jgi:hypothetical protein